MFEFLTKLFGTKSDREVKKLRPIVDEINQIYETLYDKSDEELVQRTREFQEELREAKDDVKEAFEDELDYDELEDKIHEAQQPILDKHMNEAFAIVKETCRRLVGEKWKITGQEIEWNMVPYDVQIIGGIILHRGDIAEMKTGEGKTLAATMPVYLNALTGRGVHLVTVNDYLARRDAEWMGKIYKRLGLTVGYIQNEMNPQERREVYEKDIVYGTNNEFGFDYLRDNMAIRKEDQVHRGYHYAIVDEVDSVLIDEARTPLIISGVVEQEQKDKFSDIRPLVERLMREQRKLVSELVSDAKRLFEEGEEYEGGIQLLRASRGLPKHRQVLKMFEDPGMKKLTRRVENDFMRDKKMHEIDDELYFSIDEKSNVIDLTDKGRETIAPDDPEMFVIPDLGTEISKLEEEEDLSPQEKAERRDEIQREHSERSERIHNITQLLKAYTLFEKDVEYVVQDGKVMIVDEFTGRVMPGRRFSDGLHQALEAKERVKVERETQTLATITLQNFFRLYSKLAGMTGTAATEAGEFKEIYGLDVTVIPTNEPVIRDDRDDKIYRTLREKYNAVIEDIVESNNKGQPVLVGTVTVEVSEKLSRMLKRVGVTHNVLNAKHHKREADVVQRAGQKGAVTIATNMAGRGTDIKLGEGVVEVGGLHIIGTERHEARRIDLQLKGRAGRQGDPGSSQFYLSLEDDLMRLFGSERISNVMDRLGLEEGEVIQHGMITKSIERAQKKVEARNFSIRKHLLEYDDVMNQQREVIYSRRNHALRGENLREEIMNMIEDYVDGFIEHHMDESTYPEQWDWESIRMELLSVLTIDVSMDDFETFDVDAMRDYIVEQAKAAYANKEEAVPDEVLRQIERFIYLRIIDDAWKDHLYEMDQLKEGINLRAYGQKDPLIEYKKAGLDMFFELLDRINKQTLQTLFRAQITREEEQRDGFRPQVKTRITGMQHEESSGMGFQGVPAEQQAAQQAGAGEQQAGKTKPRTVEDEPGRNDPCWCGSGRKYKRCHGK
ncbi:MAG: preprotein translocase subunit SecA [Candidatus Marinimicrobia bacterium]|nr:preprotein translocase subunit SecA [Candidatus Neomarinimicrobiota bacterium]MCF7829912.1 preprotein translocase subunit SecA [Candidatus Neomarinimicrobiota bacterium]MCF7879125.1 preprotein translocase subunit SecA [Candidatus Neomarinimicrobiota bacterium]